MFKELVEHIVKSLVDKPEIVAVDELREGNKSIVKVKVGDLDLGRVIGKDGQTIRAIRALVASIAMPDQEVSIEVSK